MELFFALPYGFILAFLIAFSLLIYGSLTLNTGRYEFIGAVMLIITAYIAFPLDAMIQFSIQYWWMYLVVGLLYVFLLDLPFSVIRCRNLIKEYWDNSISSYDDRSAWDSSLDAISYANNRSAEKFSGMGGYIVKLQLNDETGKLEPSINRKVFLSKFLPTLILWPTNAIRLAFDDILSKIVSIIFDRISRIGNRLTKWAFRSTFE